MNARNRIWVALSALLLAVLAGCTLPPAPGVNDAPTGAQAFLYGTPPFATDIARRLPTAPGHPQGYNRSLEFGGWTDPDRNGCSTREDVLRTSMVVTRTSPNNPCKILSGSFTDPYSGVDVLYTSVSPSSVMIDHLVPLKAAWSGGAWKWTRAQRVAYANEPRVLRAAEGRANLSKGDRLPGPIPRGWLPEPSYVCRYTADVLGVLDHYRLTVTPEQKQDMIAIVDGCNGVRVDRW